MLDLPAIRFGLCTIIWVNLLGVPWLKLIGGTLLPWIGSKLLAPKGINPT